MHVCMKRPLRGRWHVVAVHTPARTGPHAAPRLRAGRKRGSVNSNPSSGMMGENKRDRTGDAMDAIKIIQVKEDVRANNDRAADALRARLRDAHTLLINLMSSPGSGKTTLLSATLDRLADELSINVS